MYQIGVIGETIILLVVGGGFVAAIGLAFLKPGPRGRFSVEREVSLPNHPPDKILLFYQQRLARHGFETTKQDEESLEAVRDPCEEREKKKIHTLQNLKLTAHVETVEEGVETKARLSLTVGDYILGDSGEKAYMDALIERILSEELDRSEPPIMPTLPFLIPTAACTTGIGIGMLVFLLLGGMSVEAAFKNYISLLMAMPIPIVLVGMAAIKKIQRPREYKGVRWMIAIAVACILAIAYLAPLSLSLSEEYQALKEEKKQKRQENRESPFFIPGRDAAPEDGP